MNNPLSFDELLDYLDNDESQFVLDSVATHGFLTATVIGRPLPNWLDALFEGHVSDIPANVIDGIQRWRDSIMAELKNETPIELPFGEDAGDEEVAVLTLPMIVLSGIDDEDPELAEMRADEDKMAQMANSIEGNLTELFLLFHTND